MKPEKTYPFDPDWCICPGAILREWMEDMNVSARVLAAACGRVPVELIEAILAGDAEITPEVARRLSNGTNVTEGIWMRLEQMYRQGLAAGKTRVE